MTAHAGYMAVADESNPLMAPATLSRPIMLAAEPSAEYTLELPMYEPAEPAALAMEPYVLDRLAFLK